MNFLESIKTPTLLINKTIAKNNILSMVQKAKVNNLRFRPHFKTHQSAEIGEWYREAGVSSITVSSVTMAHYFADAGWQDILIAFPVNILEINEIVSLSQRVKLGLLIDSAVVVQKLEKELICPVELWIKIDTGYHRAGLFWENAEEIISLAEKISASANMNLRGLITHAGHVYHAKSSLEVLDIFNQTRLRMLNVKTEIQKSLNIPIEISVGDTPGCTLAEDFTGIDEIRPGNFIFYDIQQYCLGVCSLSEIAVTLACPVISLYPERNEILIYGGAIHLSKDYAVALNGNTIYGLVKLPGEESSEKTKKRYVRSISQEHGIVSMPGKDLESLSPGNLVFVYPTHSCLTLQAMQDIYLFDGEKISTMLST
jgi:D-serine deaminase-like pyridoxal phosphate-dependent protein